MSYSAVKMLELSLIESIEFDQTKPLKTPRTVGIWPIDLWITVDSGKCVFGYEDGKNKRNIGHIWNPHLQI